jgi:hypothetical protein
VSTTEVTRQTVPDEIPTAAAETARRPWTVRRVALLLAPGLIYLYVRLAGLLVLMWLSSRTKLPIGYALTSWDGQWYLGIASGGYANVPPSLVDAYGRRSFETPLAFFPGYPKLIQFLSGPFGGGEDAQRFFAFAITVVAGLFCAYGVHRIGKKVTGGSTKVGLALVALFAASPMGIVLAMTYSEALFCALAAWAMVGVIERKWLLAGLCCAAAGLVRPTAAALVLAVGLAALVAVIRKQDGWRPWAGGLIAPAGLLGYLGWVAAQTGEPTGYFALQERGWDSRFDGGAATFEFVMNALSSGRSVVETATIIFIIGAIVLAVIGFRMRVQWPLMVFALGVLAMDIGSNGLMASKARLMLPAFVLLVPIAITLAKRKTSTMVLVLSGIVLVTSWFGAYSITVWQYAI